MRPKGQDMKKLHPRFKLWLSTEDARGVLGDGKWRLLQAVGREGSLQAASKSLGISYRKAWGDLKKAQAGLGVALVEKQRGGRTGGQTTLTAQGKKWLKAYTRLRRDVEKTVATAYHTHFRGLAK